VGIQYENAPITEALIDIRVELPSGVTLKTLEALHGEVKDRYPGKKSRVYVQGRFSAGDGIGAAAKQTVMGFAYATENGKQILQVRLDGFTFSRLRPYGNWNELRDEGRRLWEIYRGAVSPLKITRVAVRYINQIDIPLRALDYKDYFRTTPEVSPDLPQDLSGFFMRLEFPQTDFGGLLILTQTAVQPPGPDMNSVILDLDVFKNGVEMVSDDEVWGLLETLRNRKNEFFEGCLTDKARELFGRKKEY
jgi:uncharacterized protein (TIGR04255 family)